MMFDMKSLLNFTSERLVGSHLASVQVRLIHDSLLPSYGGHLSYLAGGLIGADIGLGWIDQSGQLHFEVLIHLVCSSFIIMLFP
jgi:hypothetical protein